MIPYKPFRVWDDYDWWTGLFDTSPEFWSLNGGLLCTIVFSDPLGDW